MKYFRLAKDCVGTCYHEFYRGKWDNKTYWNKTSLFLHEDIFTELELFKAFNECNEDYDPYGITEINRAQWEKVLSYSEKLSIEAKAVLNEIKPWINKVLQEYGMFTILGI